MTKSSRSATLTLVLLAAIPHLAVAGPPLLCFPFEIGSARTLPMAGGDWQTVDRTYDVTRLADDTIALLDPDAPVIVRMETLRRATIYAAAHPRTGEALLARLEARAKEGGALALFDYGYAIETFRQARPMFKALVPSIDKVDGYRLVRTALSQDPDPAIEFAAAVITADGRDKADHQAHLQRAAAGAKAGSALAANLRTHFAAR